MSTTNYTVPEEHLTPAEIRTICLAMTGMARKQIADVLGIKLSTVSQRMRFIYAKLKVKSIGALIMHCVKKGFDDCGNYNGKYQFDGNHRAPFKKGKPGK